MTGLTFLTFLWLAWLAVVVNSDKQKPDSYVGEDYELRE